MGLRTGLITLWLRIRIPISNLLNLTDPYNHPVSIPDLGSFDKAVLNIQDTFKNHYRYKLDKGDRIRSVHSVYNRVIASKMFMLRGDCDDFSAYQLGIFEALANPSYMVQMFSYVPIHKFWEGHTIPLVCTLDLSQINAPKQYMIMNYNLCSPWFATPEEAINWVLALYGHDKETCVLSYDTWWDDRKWVHVADKVRVP